ncbi:MAG: FHA domain-containing protein [Bacteriovoracaceae bacterium]
MYKLVAVGGKLRGQEFVLEEGDNIVGRGDESNVVLPVNGVSKRHMSITVTSDVAYLRDLESSNGTFLNGELTKSATVKDGDLIALPDLIFKLVYVTEKKIIIHRKATETGEEEEEEPTYVKPPPMPKELPLKILHIFKYKIMPFIHGMNEEYEWKVLFSIALSLFVVATISLTIFPILSDSKQILLVETAKRGVHFAQEIARINARALEKKQLDRIDTAFLETEDGVSSYELFDMEGRIVRPIGKLNEHISDTFSIKSLEWASSKKSAKNELVQILKEGVIGVAAKINAYDAKLGSFEPVGIISIRFAPRSLAVEATKNSRAYLESLSTSALVALIFFGIVYFLTLRPFEELKYQIEQGMKGKIRNVELKHMMVELKPLVNVINTLLQRNRELSSDGESAEFAELEEEGPYIDHLKEFLKGSGSPAMVLNSNKDVMALNMTAEDLTGIRQNVSEGDNILECAREKGFAATVIELCDNSANNQGFSEQGEYELGGFNHQVFVTSLIGSDNFAKAFYVTFVKEE